MERDVFTELELPNPICHVSTFSLCHMSSTILRRPVLCPVVLWCAIFTPQIVAKNGIRVLFLSPLISTVHVALVDRNSTSRKICKGFPAFAGLRLMARLAATYGVYKHLKEHRRSLKGFIVVIMVVCPQEMESSRTIRANRAFIDPGWRSWGFSISSSGEIVKICQIMAAYYRGRAKKKPRWSGNRFCPMLFMEDWFVLDSYRFGGVVDFYSLAV